MICSSVDIGTNSVLLLVATVQNGKIETLHEEQRIPRLGQGVDCNGRLAETAVQRVLDVLNEYKELLLEFYPEAEKEMIVTATSAVRDAENRKEFIDRIKKETGWKVVLLSGSEEAQVTFLGALSVLDESYRKKTVSVLDIGGGSTEIATGKGEILDRWDSLNMGSVRFTERFLMNDPPEKSQINEARSTVKKMLRNWQSEPAKIDELVGVAGTVTSVAGIDLGLDRYDPEKINGYKLSRDLIEEKIAEFSSETPSEIEERYPLFMKGRGDVITAGLIILSEFMKHCDIERLTVSTGGIRHGILMNPKYSQV